MTYYVVPFKADVSSTEGAAAAAGQLQGIIDSHTSDGWELDCLEQIDTNIAGSSGCFGLGATPPTTVSVTMVVFKK